MTSRSGRGGFFSEKPFTAITVGINRACNADEEEGVYSELPSLIEAIKLQTSGPTEAARAIRKKLKYGNEHIQLQALFVLDALIQNAGARFQHSFADEPLLERLRILGTDSHTPPKVQQKVRTLFASWATQYNDTRGMFQIASLHRQLPQRPRPQPRVRSPSPDEEDLGSSPPAGPSTPRSRNRSLSQPSPPAFSSGLAAAAGTSKKQKKEKDKFKARPVNLEKEKPQMLQAIAGASGAATNLTNMLRRLNREQEAPSENAKITGQYRTCRELRRTVLRYIQGVENEEWLGTLIHANDELVSALQLYDKLNKPPGEDSDSDAYGSSVEGVEAPTKVTSHMKEMHIGSPPRMPPRPQPAMEEEEEEDPENPFGDSHATAE